MESKAGKRGRGKLQLVAGKDSGKKRIRAVLQHKLSPEFAAGWVAHVGPWRACRDCAASPTLAADGVIRHFDDCERLRLFCFSRETHGDASVYHCDCADSTGGCACVADMRLPLERWEQSSPCVCIHCGADLFFVEAYTGKRCTLAPTTAQARGLFTGLPLVDTAEGGTAGRAPSAHLPLDGKADEAAPATLRTLEHPSPEHSPAPSQPPASSAATSPAPKARPADRETAMQLGEFLVREEAKRRGRALVSASSDVQHIEHPDERERALCRRMALQATCVIGESGPWCGNCCRVAFSWIKRTAAATAIVFWTVTPAQWSRGLAYHAWLDGVLSIGGAS